MHCYIVLLHFNLLHVVSAWNFLLNYLSNFLCIWILPWPLVLSRIHKNAKEIRQLLDMSVFIIPVLNSGFITEFVMTWSFALAVFLVACLVLFKLGIRPCPNIQFAKLWTILRTLILKSQTKTNSLLVISRFERIFLKWFSSSFESPFAYIARCLEIFLNCYLAALQPTFGHCWGDSLTNPMLITTFLLVLTQRPLRAS